MICLLYYPGILSQPGGNVKNFFISKIYYIDKLYNIRNNDYTELLQYFSLLREECAMNILILCSLPCYVCDLVTAHSDGESELKRYI